MENKYVEKIVDEVWGKWCSIFILLLISVSVTVPSFISVCNPNNSLGATGRIVFIATIIVCIVGVNVWNTIFVYKQNIVRRAHKGKTGIIIYINAFDKTTYKNTVRKFGDEFKNNLSEGFDVIFAPYGIQPIEYRSRKIVKFLQRKKSLLFLNIGIDSDIDGNVVNYDMKISGTIIHSPYPQNVEKEFSKVFNESLKKFQEIVFPSKDMIKKMQVTAGDASVACEYVVGLSLFLNGNFDKAEIILYTLLSKVSDKSKWNGMDISINMIRFEMFSARAAVLIEKYQVAYADNTLLDKMNEYLEKANSCIKNTYFYCLNKAYYCVAKNGDVKKAKEYINLCKQKKNAPGDWKYSEAFLKAYENRSVSAICSSYKTALRVPCNIQYLITFIETFLSKEPERSGLYLALGILYDYLGDEKLKKENIDDYISTSSDHNKTIETLTKKKLYVIKDSK